MRNRDVPVSIIVPVYGTEDYLSTCIDSLCRQSYPHIQIILVDDQSPDGCPEICDTYAQKDARIKVIHQKNTGVSGARNAGLAAAVGDYIMFVDSDDELYPEAVETLLKDSFEYNADIVSATPKIVDAKGNTVSDYGDGACVVFQDDTPLLLSLNGDRNTEAVWAKLFKTDFIKDMSFEEGKNINEDIFFMFQCYVKKPILVQHNISVYRYNIRPSSCSRAQYSDKYLSILYFLKKKKDILAAYYPGYTEQGYNMEIRTYLLFLDILCSSTEVARKELEALCIDKVRNLYAYHRPIHTHHKQLAWIVKHGLYPIYRILVRIKYYR